MCGDNDQILEHLVATYQNRLLGIICGRVHSVPGGRLEPEDILQDVFTRAVQSLHTLREKGIDEFAWLYQLTNSCINDAWRKAMSHKRDYRREMPLPEQSASRLLPAGTMTSPSGAAARKEAGLIVEQVLDDLPPRYREILLMRLVDGLQYPEIAQILEISAENAAVRYHRALKQYKENGRQRFPESGFFSE